MSDGSSPFGEVEEAEGADFARELSLFDIIIIGIGAMVGGSIFVLTGLAAGESGPALVWRHPRTHRRAVRRAHGHGEKHSPARSTVRRLVRKWMGRRRE